MFSQTIVECFSSLFLIHIYNFSYSRSSSKLLIGVYLLILIYEIEIVWLFGIPRRPYHIINLILKTICRKIGTKLQLQYTK